MIGSDCRAQHLRVAFGFGFVSPFFVCLTPAWGISTGVFLCDATVTLIRRAFESATPRVPSAGMLTRIGWELGAALKDQEVVLLGVGRSSG